MEKLIEALAALFDKSAPEEVREAAAKNFIESVGKAYADGELKLPGEVGRGVMGIKEPRSNRGVTVGSGEDTRRFYELKQGFITSHDENLDGARNIPVIALRPLSGTGKEEPEES